MGTRFNKRFLQPSESDKARTRKIKDSGNKMDIQLLDLLIVIPKGGCYNKEDEGIV